MLNLIRDNVQSFGVKFVVGIVVLVMAFFGISTFRDQNSNTIVTIDGYEVKVDRFQRAFENAREEIRGRFGNRASEYLDTINLEQQIVNQLTSSALLLKSADLNGLAVSDKELANQIYTNPSFMTDERFDISKYENSLRNMRVEKLGYEKDLRENLLTRKYFQFISNGALFSRSSLQDEYKKYESVMRVKAIEFNADLFADQAKVSDEELADYYELHKANFEQKSQFVLKYFVYGVDDLKDQISVREKETAKYYENNKETEFTEKSSYKSRHILIAAPKDKDPKAAQVAQDKADDLYRQLVSDKSKFAALATQHSEDPGSARNGGELGWVEEGTFVSEFETTIASLEEGEISKPIKSDFGFHIIQLQEKKGQSIQPFDEVKENIEFSIRTNKAKRRLKSKIDKLIVDPAMTSLDQMAQSLEKETKQTDPFDDTKSLEKIGYSYNLYQELKSKKLNDTGRYNLPGDQEIVLYQVAEIKDPFIKPLEEVKEQVRFYALDEKKKQLAKEKLNEYAAKTKTEKAFEQLAKTLDTKIVDANFKFSDRQIANLRAGERFKVEAFKMSDGQIRAINDGERDFLVLMVQKQKGEINQESEQTLAALESMLQRQKAEVVLNGLINQLRREVDVEYNMPLLNAMNVRLDS